jgi:hypothetical protein
LPALCVPHPRKINPQICGDAASIGPGPRIQNLPEEDEHIGGVKRFMDEIPSFLTREGWFLWKTSWFPSRKPTLFSQKDGF